MAILPYHEAVQLERKSGGELVMRSAITTFRGYAERLTCQLPPFLRSESPHPSMP